MKFHSQYLSFASAVIMLALAIAVVLWGGGAADDEGSGAESVAQSQAGDLHQLNSPTAHIAAGEDAVDPQRGRNKSRYRIPVFVQQLVAGGWLDAPNIEIYYFCESFRANSNSSLQNFDVHNPWRNDSYQSLPSVTTNSKGSTQIEVDAETTRLYAKDGDAILSFLIAADQDWDKLAEQGVLCQIQPVETLTISVTHADGSPAPNVPLQVFTFRGVHAITDANGIAQLHLPKAQIERRLSISGADALADLALFAQLPLIGSPRLNLTTFQRGQRDFSLTLPRCSGIRVKSEPVAYEGKLLFGIIEGYVTRKVSMKKKSRDGMDIWEYPYGPLGKQFQVLLPGDNSFYHWREPSPLKKGRTLNTAGSVLEQQINWDSVFLASGKIDWMPRAKARENIRVLALDAKGRACTDPMRISLDQEGNFDIAVVAPNGDTSQIRSLWLQTVFDSRKREQYSEAEYFVQDLQPIPGQRLDLGRLQPAPVTTLIKGTAKYDDGELFYGLGLQVAKVIPDARPGKKPIHWLVNMKNEGVDNSVGFSGEFLAEHSIAPFKCDYQIRARIKDCMPYAQSFEAGDEDFEAILRLLCNVSVTYEAMLFDADEIWFELQGESGGSHVDFARGNVFTRPRADGSEPPLGRGLFQGVPPGAYSFRASTLTGQLLLEIPHVIVEGQDSKPKELQGIKLIQPGLVTLNLVDEQHQPLSWARPGKPAIQVMEKQEVGYLRSDKWSARTGTFRIHESLLTTGNFLSLPGYLPVDLEGLRHEEQVVLQKAEVKKIRIQQPADFPASAPFALQVSWVEDRSNANQILGSTKLVAINRWSYEFHCPVAGEYQLTWHLLLEPGGTPGQQTYKQQGRVLKLDPAKEGEAIVVTMPESFIAEAKLRAAKANG